MGGWIIWEVDYLGSGLPGRVDYLERWITWEGVLFGRVDYLRGWITRGNGLPRRMNYLGGWIT